MNQRTGLLRTAVLLIAGPVLIGGCCITADTLQDPAALLTACLQDVLTFLLDFARQTSVALLL